MDENLNRVTLELKLSYQDFSRIVPDMCSIQKCDRCEDPKPVCTQCDAGSTPSPDKTYCARKYTTSGYVTNTTQVIQRYCQCNLESLTYVTKQIILQIMTFSGDCPANTKHLGRRCTKCFCVCLWIFQGDFMF